METRKGADEAGNIRGENDEQDGRHSDPDTGSRRNGSRILEGEEREKRELGHQ